MTSKIEIRRPTPSITSTTFDTEESRMLRNRVILLCGMGIGASLVSYLSDYFILHGRDNALSGIFMPYYDLFYLLHPASFVLGLVVVLLIKGSEKQLQWTAFSLMFLNIVMLIWSFASFYPDQAPLFPLAIMLFVHAAFIPTKISYQVSLALSAFLLFPVAELVTLGSCPIIQAWWANHGGIIEFQERTLSTMVSIAVLGVITVMATKTLYNMRRDLKKAERLGNYIIQEELGSGGMGKVYVASHALMKRLSAVKILKSEDGDYETAIARFEREVRLSSLLTHPNTITIFDYGRTSRNTFYYAMEFLEGMDLQKFIEQFGPLPSNRVVFLLKQVCGSLAEAHLRDIIHRDIKPSNIFITHRGGLFDFVKVLDFGLAKEVKQEQGANITKTGAFFGTPRYIAPESVYGKEAIDARADIYNVGAVAYWMLTGQPLFAGSSSVELLVDHVKTTPPPPSTLTEVSMNKDLETAVMKCLQKDREDRFQSAIELYQALDAIQFADEWSRNKACEWWNLHLSTENMLRICPHTGRLMKPEDVAPPRRAQAS